MSGCSTRSSRWYRTADIECSFRVKDAGLRALVGSTCRSASTSTGCGRSTPPAERDRLSKRNYYRFLERFRDRFDLLVEPPTIRRPALGLALAAR